VTLSANFHLYTAYLGTWDAIGYIAQAYGLKTTSASKSAFLGSLAVVMVPILDFLAGKSLSRQQFIGALLAVVGVGFLEFEGATATSMLQAFSLTAGDICSMIQPVAFGIGFWRMERVMHKYPDEACRGTAAQLLAVFLGSAAYMGIVGVTDPSSIPPREQLIGWVTDPYKLGTIFWTGVITTALTMYLETVALKTLSAAETTLLMSTEPVWGSAFATICLGEHLTMSSGIGGAIILFGCLYSNSGLSGLLQLLPAMRNAATEECEKELLEDHVDLEEEAISLIKIPNATQSGSLFSKFSLKARIAGVLSGVVPKGAESPPISANLLPEELKEFLDD
jgi:drug/metabolite transporter (DMT)-like permease